MKLYNTLTRSIEDFVPREGKKVQLFVCGPTVYDYSHLGHAKTYIQFDVLARTLKALGFDLSYLQNITDIDDKIIARAQEKDMPWQQLAQEFETAYYEDMEALNNMSVTKYTKATDYVTDIIQQVQVLLDKGHAYKIEDGIYFEVATFPDYGKLSGRQEVQKDDAQSRIDHSDEKKGWNDFCLWKFTKPGEPEWDAPFGKGRPGWHIEDTAITEHFFGPQYDVHGGAVDLIFPHHEAELTQMEAASGKVPFVKYWVHTGFLTIDDEKMSKSLGNFATIRDVIAKGYDPMAIRLLMLQSHYRSQAHFSWENLDAAQNRLQDLRAMAALRWQPRQVTHDSGTFALEDVPNELRDILANDLDTPNALAFLSRISTQLLSVHIERDMVDHFNSMLKGIDDLFGLNLLGVQDISDEQKELIKQREEARQQQDWSTADTFRDKLKEQGIGLNDASHGPIWFPL